MREPDRSVWRRSANGSKVEGTVAKVELGQHRLQSTDSYTNPVFKRSFPDPFVLKFGGSFYGYSTGFSSDGKSVFPVIRSTDLVDWEDVGAAMDPLEAAPPFYWAPEVTYSDGRFYLYYSCGNEVNMELRVAVSDRPDTGFIDSDVRLTSEQFAIDAHVFIDDDGQRYLFYATDFLSHSHIGTGTVVDRMVDWFQLEGSPRPVTRAKYDWQVYDPRRAEKGNVRWHTVEGPSVLKRKGKYFQMFSGGNWKNESYGVGSAVSERVLNSEEWKQSIDGTTILPILRTVDKVLGPGHNSVVPGPNNRELFCVYHSWVNDQRVMSVDRMDLVDDRIIVLGPTVSAQPKPFPPRSASQPDESGTRIFEGVAPDFLLEATFRLLSHDDGLGFYIMDADRSRIAELSLSHGNPYFSWGNYSDRPRLLPTEVRFSDYQCLWIEVNRQKLQLRLNGRLWYDTDFDVPLGNIQIEIAQSPGAEILNLDLTEGFVDMFESDLGSEDSGWLCLSGDAAINTEQRGLVISSQSTLSIAAKGACFGEFEFASNVRSLSGSGVGFALLSSDDKVEMLIECASTETAQLVFETGIRTEMITLPTEYSLSRYTQFRFVKQDGHLAIDLEGMRLAQIKVSSDPSRLGIVTNGRLSVEMVRAVRIG